MRVVLISSVLPIAGPLVERLRELGHEPVAWLLPRRPAGRPAPPWGDVTDAVAPAGVSLVFARDKWAVEPLLRGLQPDLALCWGFPWKLPQAAIDVPRLGSVNQHPGLLPRHRGPIPISWALREGDRRIGVTWHRMEAELDTGPILAQSAIDVADEDCTIDELGPKLAAAALELLPRVLERVEAGDPGEPQPGEGATWAGHFGEDYATVDWTQSARRIHDQVRAWALALGPTQVAGPIADLDGARVRLLRTSLSDPGGGARPVECGDGTLWVVGYEPAE